MKKTNFLLLGPLFILIFSCSGKVVKEDINRKDGLMKIDHQITPLNNKSDYWKVTELDLEKQGRLNHLYVTKDNNIIIISDSGMVYKSRDAGLTWEKIDISLPEKYYVTSVNFPSSDSCCVAISNFPQPLNDHLESTVLCSHGEMKKWITVYQRKNIYIKNISFVNETTGVISGSDRSTHSLLFLFTKDEGNKWDDISSNINSIIAVDALWSEAIDVQIYENNRTTTIASDGKVYLFDSETLKWVNMGDIDLNITYDRISRMKKTSNGLCLVSGRDGPEGFGGYFKRWIKGGSLNTTFMPINLKDFDLASDSQLVSCGDSLAEDTRDNSATKIREGIIIYSTDGGRSWKTIYRNRKVVDLRSVAFINDKTVVAISGSGTFIKLSQTK